MNDDETKGGGYMDQISGYLQEMMKDPEKMGQAAGMFADLNKELFKKMGLEAPLDGNLLNAPFEEINEKLDRIFSITKRIGARVRRLEEHNCPPLPKKEEQE